MYFIFFDTESYEKNYFFHSVVSWKYISGRNNVRVKHLHCCLWAIIIILYQVCLIGTVISSFAYYIFLSTSYYICLQVVCRILQSAIFGRIIILSILYRPSRIIRWSLSLKKSRSRYCCLKYATIFHPSKL